MSALDLTRGGGRKPLAIDICCGLGGWTDGLLAEGWQVVGIDIEEHAYGEHRYPAGLIIQDVLTVDGKAFSGADLIVASPPCQRYSWMAMPWSSAKAAAAAIRADETGVELERLNALFNACFRIQAEASAAAGRHIPLIVENVRGAEPWVGRARYAFGSFLLWGDVPALMPTPHKARKLAGFRFDGSGRSFQSASVEHTGVKAPGMNWSKPGKDRRSFTDTAGMAAEGRKGAGAGAGAEWFDQNLCQLPSASPRRKMASAMIAKIPMPLSTWIARCFYPRASEAA